MTRPWSTALLVLAWGCVPSERQPEAGGKPEPSATLSARPPLEPLVIDGRDDAAPDRLPVLSRAFRDDFERDAVGDDYHATSSAYRIEDGRLCVKGARNRPLWLRHRLPLNARIEVEAQSQSAEGDIKLEAWGDGQAAASRLAYTDATSYLAVFGGWKNRFHVLARLDEHAADRAEVLLEPGSDDPRERPVISGKRYRLKLERTDGRTVRFSADDVEILSFIDPLPLSGGGHDHFAFNNWETSVCFDHLVVEPLPS